MQVPISNTDEWLEVQDGVFNAPYNESLVHQAVCWWQAKSHPHTQAQKNRAAVRGGGAKPWRQKGTGRARHGTIRSPIWRGGGVTFAAQSGCHMPRLNRKMYRGAIRSILSELIREDRLMVVRQITIDAPKTKVLKDHLSVFDIKSCLLVLSAEDVCQDIVKRAAANLPNVDVCRPFSLGPMILVGSKRVLLTEKSVREIEQWLM